jgi:hypothetical protein
MGLMRCAEAPISSFAISGTVFADCVEEVDGAHDGRCLMETYKMNQALSRLRWRCSKLLVVCSLHFAPCAHADMPFLRLETATVEHDDERNFEVSAQLSRTKDEAQRRVAVEYNISPLSSVEAELSFARARNAVERERELGLGYRYVLVDHNRDDWGLALKVAAEWEKSTDQDGTGPWRYAGPTVLAAFILPLADNRIRLHANWGVHHKRATGERQQLWGAGVEADATPTLTAFAEWGAIRQEDRLQHAGLRWWIKRDKVAVQLSGSRTRDAASGETFKGVHVGMTFSDLSF